MALFHFGNMFYIVSYSKCDFSESVKSGGFDNILFCVDVGTDH